ncbi:MAG: D-glycero-alpha-D-manno-heptose-1,7-bisphosphate 7-phosphatase [Phycisphaerales bacterium JB059]
MRPLRPAVFLDRDDTLNVNADLPPEAWARTKEGDLLDPCFVQLIPGALEACRRLADAGYVLVVITNQGGVARGGGSTRDIDACNTALRARLTPTDSPEPETIPEPFRASVIAASYSAPHHPTGDVPPFDVEHPWRKPGPGMIEAAAEELGLDLARSWMVGDKQRDLDAATGAGVSPARTLLIGPNAELPDLSAAADRILAEAIDPAQTSRVTLRARTGSPLADSRARETVIATARAIAERTGVRLLETSTTDESVTVSLATHRLGALGFLTELRRLTNAWSRARSGADLWPDEA